MGTHDLNCWWGGEDGTTYGLDGIPYDQVSKELVALVTDMETLIKLYKVFLEAIEIAGAEKIAQIIALASSPVERHRAYWLMAGVEPQDFVDYIFAL